MTHDVLLQVHRRSRPALQRILADIAAGRIDIVAVYKVDRLTRSLLDFAKLAFLSRRTPDSGLHRTRNIVGKPGLCVVPKEIFQAISIT